MISRSITKCIPSMRTTFVTACGASTEYVFSTAFAVNASCAAVSSGGMDGDIIDRLAGTQLAKVGSPGLGALFLTAEPFAWIRTCRGSTAADKHLTLGIKLQHGDSSGGGDMADYSTGSQPAIRNYFTTAETTEYNSLTTEALHGLVSYMAPYDLSGAKRYIRTVTFFGYPSKATTESTGYDPIQVGANIVFRDAGELPAKAMSTGFGSTSTSTTT